MYYVYFVVFLHFLLLAIDPFVVVFLFVFVMDGQFGFISYMLLSYNPLPRTVRSIDAISVGLLNFNPSPHEISPASNLIRFIYI